MSSPADRSKDVLHSLDMWKIPINPFAIAREEGIDLAPGDYGEKFDARLEYLPSVKTFVIYYRESGRTEGRIRFSIAHELGHYYMPEHREGILKGKLHNSECDFRSRDPREQEADDFAASLLMPKELFVQEVHRHYNRVCTLRELSSMAERKFETSITSTARRYCECGIEAANRRRC
jgi:Zn-dependent peptidase ImmA (M78 family)